MQTGAYIGDHGYQIDDSNVDSWQDVLHVPDGNCEILYKNSWQAIQLDLIDRPGNDLKVYADQVPPPVSSGSLSIASMPSGASVYLDETYKGITPLIVSNVSPGRHTIKLTKPGYENYTENVSVIADGTESISKALTLTPYESALAAINNAQSAIDSAKTIGADTTEARKLLQMAEAALEVSNYKEAEKNANQAKESAKKARNEMLILYGIVALLTIALIIIIVAVKRDKKKKVLIYMINELIDNGCHECLISEKDIIDTLKKMKDAIAHNDIIEAKNCCKSLDLI